CVQGADGAYIASADRYLDWLSVSVPPDTNDSDKFYHYGTSRPLVRFKAGWASEGAVTWFFFFSSRRRHTRLASDWSSDVCSSDLFMWRRAISSYRPSSRSDRGALTTSSPART